MSWLVPPPSSLPLPFPLCVSCHPCPCVTIPIPCVVVSVWCEACHMHCVWWLALSNTLPCCAPSSLLFSFCPSLFHHHHLKKTQGCEEKRGRKEWLGKEREEEERCDAKTSEKKEPKKEKKRLRHLVFPGCLQP